jgi:sulfatase modifying factor 1
MSQKNLDQNKAIKIVKVIADFTSEKAFEVVIDALGGKYVFLGLELSKRIHTILANGDEHVVSEILEDAFYLDEDDIVRASQEIAHNMQYDKTPLSVEDCEKSIQDALKTLRLLQEKFQGKNFSKTELLETLRATMLNDKTSIDISSSQPPTALASIFIETIISDQTSHSKKKLDTKDIPQIQGFEIKSILGEGGYATVYLAYHTVTKQVCALKIGKLQQVDLFHREVKNMKLINHKNVLSCFDSGICKHQNTDHYWIAMPNMLSITLQQLIQYTQLKPENQWEILNQILQGLCALHKQEIAHRDLKPSNCLISENFEIKLSDFGLSKNLSTDQKDHTIMLTRQAKPIGTLAYMSPEQIQGKNISLSSDVWSFAVLAYQIFTKQLPFESENNHLVLSASILKDPPKLTEIEDKVPATFLRILEKCLQKNQNDRYLNAIELGKDFFAISEPEIEKIKDEKQKRMQRIYQENWKIVLSQQLIEKYVMRSIKQKKIFKICANDWQRNYAKFLISLEQLDDILDEMKSIALKENWIGLVIDDLERYKNEAFDHLTFRYQQKEKESSDQFKKKLSSYSTDESNYSVDQLVEKVKEITLEHEDTKIKLKVWYDESQKEIETQYEKKKQQEEILMGKLTSIIHQIQPKDVKPSVSFEQAYNEQGNLLEIQTILIPKDTKSMQRDIDVPFFKEIETEIETEIPQDKKWWEFWKPLVIKVKEKVITQEELLSIKTKKISRESIIYEQIVFNMVYCTEGNFSYDTHMDIYISKGFWLAETLVTQALWQAVMSHLPHDLISEYHPVVSITLYDCFDFCNRLSKLAGFQESYYMSDIEKIDEHIVNAKVEWLKDANGYRLPTEIEWKYAAYANSNFIYSGSNDIEEVAWFMNNADKQTHMVKKKKPNAWGLYDLSGNVDEWCMECVNENTYLNQKFSIDLQSSYEKNQIDSIICGGSFLHEAKNCSLLSRSKIKAKSQCEYLGFRILRPKVGLS